MERVYWQMSILPLVLLLFCGLFSMNPGAALADKKNYEYSFFSRFTVEERLDLACTMPCGTARVTEQELYFEGGFNIVGGKVQGAGIIKVYPPEECMVEGQHGGNQGCSCRILGVKGGSFAISGIQTEVVSLSGHGFVPEVKVTLAIDVQPDLLVLFFLPGMTEGVPVNHYESSFIALLEKAGLVGRPVDILPVAAEDFIDTEKMNKISQQFTAEIVLPAPGIKRKLIGNGYLAFTKSPFVIAD